MCVDRWQGDDAVRLSLMPWKVTFFLLLEITDSFYEIFWILKIIFPPTVVKLRVSNRGRVFDYFGFTVIAVIVGASAAVAGTSIVPTEATLLSHGNGREGIRDVLLTKRDRRDRSWLSCHINDNVDDAMKNMAQHNIGSLVVLKPGDQHHIAGIITERDYLTKIIGRGRSPKYTRVGEIMSDENKLITVKSDTNILQAMQLMIDNHIRHVPVIDGRMVGMVSIVDVVRAVVEQQNGELKRLNDFIKGDYY
ncbi:CBS domain-containing protein CBSX3 [Hibiscus syriacus]|uniref:CBS domain-containing protein CBSX3 n=1 Tax=Hibiscus syriacus TaxID=106335 RepID=A0A6A3CL34_HIBSY|nr:CBS domain-containing protein CBSX3 [Hibiscus syriacus]